MAKTKSAYVCTDCGTEHSQWQGQCASCNAWNTLSRVALGAAKTPSAPQNFPLGGDASRLSGVPTLSLALLPL